MEPRRRGANCSPFPPRKENRTTHARSWWKSEATVQNIRIFMMTALSRQSDYCSPAVRERLNNSSGLVFVLVNRLSPQIIWCCCCLFWAADASGETTHQTQNSSNKGKINPWALFFSFPPLLNFSVSCEIFTLAVTAVPCGSLQVIHGRPPTPTAILSFAVCFGKTWPLRPENDQTLSPKREKTSAPRRRQQRERINKVTFHKKLVWVERWTKLRPPGKHEGVKLRLKQIRWSAERLVRIHFFACFKVITNI